MKIRDLLEITGDYIYYLYRHIRLDKNEVFYIGIGKVLKRDLNTSSYQSFHNRAFSKQVKKRSSFWNKIINKTDYKIEILIYHENVNFILEKEKEFIELYGRKDLNKGTLVNLTDGGEGTSQWSPERRLKISKLTEERHKLRTVGFRQKHTAENLEKIRYSRQNICKITQKDMQGNFIKEWKSAGQIKRELGIDSSCVLKCCKKKIRYYKNFIWQYTSSMDMNGNYYDYST